MESSMGHPNTPNDQFRVSGPRRASWRAGSPQAVSWAEEVESRVRLQALAGPWGAGKKSRDQQPLSKKQEASRSTGLEQTSPLMSPTPVPTLSKPFSVVTPVAAKGPEQAEKGERERKTDRERRRGDQPSWQPF